MISSLRALAALRSQAFMGLLIGSNKEVGLVFWVTVIFVLTAFEVAGRMARMGSRFARCPTSAVDLITRYLRRPVLRVIAIAVWLFAGWHLFSH